MTTYKEDPFVESIKSKGYYSNTRKQTKWYDGIDLTIGQNFREEKETINKPQNISLWADFNYIKETNEPNTYDNNRFFYQERMKEEFEFYKKYGCECCGRKLIMPTEISYGICYECDRRMFSRTKARVEFSELPERNTCCPKEFYRFVDKIEKIETHTQTIWTFFNKIICKK